LRAPLSLPGVANINALFLTNAGFEPSSKAQVIYRRYLETKRVASLAGFRLGRLV